MKEFGLRLLDTLSVEISVAVFFGIGVGAVLGTAIVLLMIC